MVGQVNPGRLNVNQVISYNLRRRRRAVGLTQRELAALMRSHGLVKWNDYTVINAERAYRKATGRRLTAEELIAFCFATVTGLLEMFQIPPGGAVSVGKDWSPYTADNPAWRTDLLHVDEALIDEDYWFGIQSERENLRELAWKLIEKEEAEEAKDE